LNKEEEAESLIYMRALIDQIWMIYDDDGNGVLDFDETKNFIIDYL